MRVMEAGVALARLRRRMCLGIVQFSSRGLVLTALRVFVASCHLRLLLRCLSTASHHGLTRGLTDRQRPVAAASLSITLKLPRSQSFIHSVPDHLPS